MFSKKERIWAGIALVVTVISQLNAYVFHFDPFGFPARKIATLINFAFILALVYVMERKKELP